MKKFTKVVESYEMEEENYENFATEHAKKIISSYIDGKLGGKTLQDAYNELADDMLVDAGEGPEEMVIQAIETFSSNLLLDAKELEMRIEPKISEMD